MDTYVGETRAGSQVGARQSFNNSADRLSVIAARLLDAACFARYGDREAAKACIAHAAALLREEPDSIPAVTRPLDHSALKAARGGLAAWQKRRLIAYIDTHLARRVRNEDLAALLDLSVGHFCRAFKSAFGLSAHDYLIRRRMEAAQGLMLTTSDPLGAIALSCGMSDQSHFSRWFRRIVGETPGQWRRARQGALEDRAWSNRDSDIESLLFDPFILRLKDEPRFAAFCRKVGLPAPGEVRPQT